MNATAILAQTAFLQTLRSRAVIGYAAALVGIVSAVALFGGEAQKVTLTLVSLVLLVVPLVTLLIVAVEHYNGREFLELLLAQPISRHAYYWGQWVGMSAALCVASCMPLLLGYAISSNYDPVVVVVSALVLTLCFSALAYRIAIGQQDKARGIGIALLVWLYCAVLYDALLVALMALLEQYPLEKVLLVALALNPIDAVRVAVLLRSDAAALMGVTGAALQEVVGKQWSTLVVAAVVAAWILYPLLRGAAVFRRRDF